MYKKFHFKILFLSILMPLDFPYWRAENIKWKFKIKLEKWEF